MKENECAECGGQFGWLGIDACICEKEWCHCDEDRDGGETPCAWCMEIAGVDL